MNVINVNHQALIDNEMDHVAQQALQFLNQSVPYSTKFEHTDDGYGNALGLTAVPYPIVHYSSPLPVERSKTTTSSIASSTPPLINDLTLSPSDVSPNLQPTPLLPPSMMFHNYWSTYPKQQQMPITFQQIQTPQDFHGKFDASLKRNSMIEERKRSILIERSRLNSLPENNFHHPYRHHYTPQSRSSIRDEQNRQKSKRYYERKKAQNVALQSLCTALDEMDPDKKMENNQAEASNSTSSSTTLSERRKITKALQKDQESRQFQRITRSAVELEKVLKSTSCSNLARILASRQRRGMNRGDSTEEEPEHEQQQHSHLIVLEKGLSIWLDHIQLWSDLIAAEKRMNDSDEHCFEKPIQKFIALLSKIS